MSKGRRWAEGFLSTVAAVFVRPWVWASLLFLFALGAGLGIGSWSNLCADCPSIAQIHTWEPQQTSKVYSHDGQLIAELGIERRTAVAIDALPPHVPQAFIAIEDRRFYEHGGFDVRAIGRAAIARLLPTSTIRSVTGFSLRTGGASTITQQLARNIFVETIGFDVRVERKLKEIQVALEIERAYTKDQILEAYMNQINLGPGWWGIQTASRNYFGKNAIDLNPAEGAMLAAVGNRPGAYSPFRDQEAALSRRNLVLDRMASEGFLSESEAEEWKTFPLPTERARVSEGSAPYLVEFVRQEVQARFGNQLYTAGFQIHTTIDLEMQRAAEIAMARGFDRIEERPGFRHPTFAEYMASAEAGEELSNTPYLQGAMVVLDPQTGAIRAMVGGRDFNHSKFDRVRLARRQPGSSFKTFVYAAALANGIPASHIISDNPGFWEQGPGLDPWSPRNFDREFYGDMTLREAYRRSINTVAAKLGNDEVGLETIAQTAQRLGIRTPIPRYPAMPIGSPDVIPLQLAEAYATIAALGVRSPATAVRRVLTADGDLLWEPVPDQTQVLDPLSARITVSLMEDVVAFGTGNNGVRNVAGLPYEIPAAGKTGTTNDGTDVWFVGFTPTLQALVWFGMDQPQTIHAEATGGGFAAPVWGEFMRQVYVGDIFPDESTEGSEAPQPLLPAPEPWSLDGLVMREVDSRTGLLASPWCPADRAYLEYFIPGTEPTEECDDTARGGPSLRWPW
ncbi:MAG: PBP1A family penicillin-binding protein [Gemmatimonadota bacterium]